ncbi:helix-turn-helix domain-containing protein [Enterococcus sp. AZ154]|uniref:helix-turn-helix domain-containing protein n=1 Tax=Enterococcus sp. AZ154 TaxID=2774683 RepID=UPI003D2A95CA
MIPTELADFFLTKSQLQKLYILKQLETKIVPFSELEEQLNISKRKIKEFVSSLSEEILSDPNNYPFTITMDKEKIHFSKNIEASEYVKLTNDFRGKYLSESSLFQVLLFVLEKRVFSVLNMANELSYSESYAYKLFGKLKQFLYFMDLGIHITKKNETLVHLTGDESSIRILHYLVISVASKGNHWLFKTITEKEILSTQAYIKSERYEKLSPIGKSRVNYILAVYELALKNGYKLSEMDKEVIALGDAINKEKEINIYLKYLQKEVVGNEVQLHEELIHLAFFINYFTQEIRTDKEKIALGNYLYSLKYNSIVKDCIKVLNMIVERYNLPKDSYFLLLYSLCNRLVVIHYLGLFKFMPLYKVPPIIGQVKSYVENCLDTGLDSYKKSPSFNKIKYSFTQIITGYLLLLLPAQQKVYVEFFHRPEYKSIVENAIKHNYNDEVINITNDYSKADIIISDTYGYDTSKFFYFKDVFDQDSWEELGLYLNQVISKELIER